VLIDWATGAMRVREELADSYRREGEQGLARRLSQVLAVRGVWWMDALSGTLLRRKTAELFDYDLQPPRPGTHWR
jgi:hypothetical protein